MGFDTRFSKKKNELKSPVRVHVELRETEKNILSVYYLRRIYLFEIICMFFYINSITTGTGPKNTPHHHQQEILGP